MHWCEPRLAVCCVDAQWFALATWAGSKIRASFPSPPVIVWWLDGYDRGEEGAGEEASLPGSSTTSHVGSDFSPAVLCADALLCRHSPQISIRSLPFRPSPIRGQITFIRAASIPSFFLDNCLGRLSALGVLSLGPILNPSPEFSDPS